LKILETWSLVSLKGAWLPERALSIIKHRSSGLTGDGTGCGEGMDGPISLKPHIPDTVLLGRLDLSHLDTLSMSA
jgi:hypothetical protein